MYRTNRGAGKHLTHARYKHTHSLTHSLIHSHAHKWESNKFFHSVVVAVVVVGFLFITLRYGTVPWCIYHSTLIASAQARSWRRRRRKWKQKEEQLSIVTQEWKKKQGRREKIYTLTKCGIRMWSENENENEKRNYRRKRTGKRNTVVVLAYWHNSIYMYPHNHNHTYSITQTTYTHVCVCHSTLYIQMNRLPRINRVYGFEM